MTAFTQWIREGFQGLDRESTDLIYLIYLIRSVDNLTYSVSFSSEVAIILNIMKY